MTAPSTIDAPTAESVPPRRGSRAAGFAQPLAIDVVRQLAEEHGVCTRPQLLRMVDETTRLSQVIEVPCRSTRESKCKPCARRAKRLRMAQCREGWHCDKEHPDVGTGDELQRALVARRAELEFTKAAAQARADWTQAEHDQAGITEVEKLITAVGLRGRIVRKDDDQDGTARRKRSTRRRQDAPKLPRRRVRRQTVGRTFTGP